EMLVPSAIATHNRFKVVNPRPVIITDRASAQALLPLRHENMQYDPPAADSKETPPIKSIHIEIQGVSYYLAAVYSNDGYYDIRTMGSHKSSEELPLLSPEMKLLGIGQPLDALEIQQIKRTRKVINTAKKKKPARNKEEKEEN